MAYVLPRDGKVGANVISTGNSEIDKKMGGGIPMRSLTLIEGQPAAGKSVLSQQMIWGSLNDRRKTLLYTTENTGKDLCPADAKPQPGYFGPSPSGQPQDIPH